MPEEPPPIVTPPPAWSPQPERDRRARTTIIVTTIVALLVITVVGAAKFLPGLLPKPNVRPDTLPPHTVAKVDGWMDMEFYDLGVTVRVPARPAANTRNMSHKDFNPDFASDYIEYASTGDSCVILVYGTWLSPKAVAAFAKPDAIQQHNEQNYGSPADPIEIRGLPPGAAARHSVVQVPGYPPNNVIQVSLLRKKDLLVEIAVNTDGDKEQAIARIEKALAGFKLSKFESAE